MKSFRMFFRLSKIVGIFFLTIILMSYTNVINSDKLFEIPAQTYAKGVHCQNINTSALKPGMYFIVGVSNNSIEQKTRFIKQ